MDDVPLLVDVSENIHELDEDVKAVPVTVVTGYLGSGKSTMLQYLAKNSTKKIAVVLNEFGNTSDIEKSLVIRNQENGMDVEEWVELDNGCMCCTAKDAGVAAIEKLIQRNKKSGKPIDHVIIETSGLADPAKIAAMFWLDNALLANVKLDGVVTVVDAKTFCKSFDENKLAGIQVACADVILVNKCDTTSQIEVERVKNIVNGINSAAKVYSTTYGQAKPDQVMGLDAYAQSSSNRFTELTKDQKSDSHGLSTVAIDLCRINSFNIESFERKIQHLLWENELNGSRVVIHRTKGRLQLHKEKQTKIIQAVRDVYEIVNIPYEPNADFKIIFIGENIKELENELSRFLLDI